MYDKNADYRKQLYIMIAIVVFALLSVGVYAYGQHMRHSKNIVTFVSPDDACQYVDIKTEYSYLIGTYITINTNSDMLAPSGYRKIYVEVTDQIEGCDLINVFTTDSKSTPVGSTVTIRVVDVYLAPFGDGNCSVNFVGEVIDI